MKGTFRRVRNIYLKNCSGDDLESRNLCTGILLYLQGTVSDMIAEVKFANKVMDCDKYMIVLFY
jgi:hypothetical protein